MSPVPSAPPATNTKETRAAQETLWQIVYVSSATHPWSQRELTEGLEKFRANNVRRGVTGMLLHMDGNFMQAIEGPRDVLLSLEKTIAADPRHHGFITLVSREVPEREFEGWSMGFRNLGGREKAELPGWSDFLSQPFVSESVKQSPGRALKLLLSFRQTMR